MFIYVHTHLSIDDFEYVLYSSIYYFSRAYLKVFSVILFLTVEVSVSNDYFMSTGGTDYQKSRMGMLLCLSLFFIIISFSAHKAIITYTNFDLMEQNNAEDL
jgi:hypothetical protein